MRTFAILLALVILSGAARAQETCEHEPTATIESPAGTYYVDVDDCTLDGSCLFSIWIYQESNGIPGLQHCPEEGIPECECGTESDTILF